MAIEPVLVHVMFSVVPTTHASLPFGAVSVRDPLISNSASDMSFTVSSDASATCTFRLVPIASDTVQEYVPVEASVEATMTFPPGKVVPPSVEYRSSTLAMDPVRTHVTFFDSPTTHSSLPFGAVSCSLPLIRKLASDASVTSAFDVSVTRTRSWSPIASGTAHSYVPNDASTVAVITFGNVPPPSVEYSSFTSATLPTLVHVMFSSSLTYQISAPFGAVTVTLPLIMKSASDSSNTSEFPTSVTFTRTVVPMASGIAHAYVPMPASVAATISFGYGAPPVTEYSSFTLAIDPNRFHVISCDEPTSQLSVPLGAVRVSEPFMVKLSSDSS